MPLCQLLCHLEKKLYAKRKINMYDLEEIKKIEIEDVARKL